MKNKKGFTIIEVVLVLAIAGLIFLMVFIALPALQRSQRNAQRKNDMSRFITAVTTYASNNSNRSPFIGTTGEETGKYAPPSTDQIANFVNRYIDGGCGSFTTTSTADGYSRIYHASGNCGAQFQDPDGETYGLDIRIEKYIQGTRNAATGEIAVKYPTDPNGVNRYSADANILSHLITIFSAAKCGMTEGTVIQTNGKNDIAVFYVLEGGSVSCADNQ